MTDTAAKPKPKPTAKLTSMHVHAAGLVGVLSLAGLAYALAYVPTSKAMAQAESQRQAIIRANEDATTLANDLRVAREELSSLRDATRELETRKDPPLVRITDSLVMHALTVDNLTESRPMPEGHLDRIVLQVDASGGFSDIVAWIEDVHTTMRRISIDSLSIMPQPADQTELVLQASLSAYSPQPAPPPGGHHVPPPPPHDGPPPAR